MKKTGRFLLAGLIAFFLSVILPGCEQESHIYDGPPVVEFSNFSWGLDHATTARPHYTWVGTGAFWATTIAVPPAGIDTSLQVQLVAPHHPHDLTLSYRIVDSVFRLIARNIIVLTPPDSIDGRPAEVGRDFVILPTPAMRALPANFTVLNNGEITIPANSSFGRLRFRLDPAALPTVPAAPAAIPLASNREIWIVLEPGTVEPSANFRIFRLRIHRTRP